jgi:hypothetical protein
VKRIQIRFISLISEKIFKRNGLTLLSPHEVYTIPYQTLHHASPLRTEQLADDGAGLQTEGGQSTLLAVVVVIVVHSAVNAVG